MVRRQLPAVAGSQGSEKVLQQITNEGKAEIEKEYGKVSTSTTGIILRKIVEMEQQG